MGSKPISKITPDDVRKLYRDVQRHGRIRGDPEYGHALSASTVRRLHGVFHLAMDTAVRARLIPQNPTHGVTLPKKETAPRKILNDAQLERFMEEIRKDPIWYDFFYTELTTGLRKGEICGLMWSDFDSKQGTLSVRRTIHRRRGGGVTAGATKTSFTLNTYAHVTGDMQQRPPEKGRPLGGVVCSGLRPAGISRNEELPG